MASSKIKKVVIPRNSLPPVGPNNVYLVRYRIVSEDKNRSSHWSHLWRLIPKPADESTGNVEITESMIMVGWKLTDIQSYDIFASVDGGDWELQGSSKSNSFIFIKPTIVSEISIAVQAESYLKEYNADLVIFDQTIVV